MLYTNDNSNDVIGGVRHSLYRLRGGMVIEEVTQFTPAGSITGYWYDGRLDWRSLRYSRRKS